LDAFDCKIRLLSSRFCDKELSDHSDYSLAAAFRRFLYSIDAFYFKKEERKKERKNWE
jgi:hypothetical protein